MSSSSAQDHVTTGLHCGEWLEHTGDAITDQQVLHHIIPKLNVLAPHLACISLSNNSITDQGARALVDAIKVAAPPFLRRIDVSRNVLTRDGAAALAEVVGSGKLTQLNVGGNMDFKNMLERDRLESKKISKTNSVTSQLDYDLGDKNVHIGPSDYIPWLDEIGRAHV